MYKILRRIAPIAYEMKVPHQLSDLHNVFDVSQLRKYVPILDHVLEADDIQVLEDLTVDLDQCEYLMFGLKSFVENILGR
ncbi:hypothetical protein VIGAN_06068700 [Vigna angularis var. angularis]|uniref:Tf2-1-like SH3-like domain-containing protein n=1 Tax=Vigna angularis var. angularis TaxID=157739 RepID=A0A0S3SA40_PHAAN|nr:hypothetical protein VIGAN_06068700 [Vigna angularis var. angularis]